MLVCSLSCFTTEILEGFDVQRTSGFADTIRKYGYLTQSITQYYSTHLSYGSRRSRVCPSFDEFVKKCHDLEKMTVSDVFALQLMQVTLPTKRSILPNTQSTPPTIFFWGFGKHIHFFAIFRYCCTFLFFKFWTELHSFRPLLVMKFVWIFPSVHLVH